MAKLEKAIDVFYSICQVVGGICGLVLVAKGKSPLSISND